MDGELVPTEALVDLSCSFVKRSARLLAVY